MAGKNGASDDFETNVGIAGAVDQGVPGIQGSAGIEKNIAQPPMVEVGTSGLAQFSGLIFQEPLIELRGKEAYKRYDEMRRNSPIVSALLLSIENPIRSTSWNFASDLGEDDPRLELLNMSIENMEHTLNDHISECLTMLPFGFSIFEKVYEQVNGKWLWKKFAPRSQNTILRWIYEEVAETNEVDSPKSWKLRGFVQLAPPKYRIVPIPIERLMIYRIHTELDNPEGRSILRSAWIPYFYIKHMQQIEGIGIERDLAGLPVITLPEGATTGSSTTDDAKAAKIVRNVRNDEQSGVVLPQGWKLELLHSGGGKQIDVDKTISRHTKDILTSALAQFLMLGQNGIGSMALSKDQTDFFTMSINSIADIITETFTHDSIPDLMKLNGYDAKGLRLEHTPAQGELGIQVLAQALQQIAPMLNLRPEDEVWIRQMLGMPEIDVEVLQQAQNDKEAQRKAMADALAKAQAAKQNQPTEETAPQDVRMDAFKAQFAPDKAKRDKMERDLKKAVLDYQAKAKARVLKAAKGMR